MQDLHMNKGEGETSYAKNSLVQKKMMSDGSSMVEAAIVNILLELQPESMGVADLGCSSGPNSLTAVYQIINIVDSTSRKMGRPVPELRVFLNDLPSNDFNNVFISLPEFHKKLKNDYGIEDCYVWGVPGSFYGRLFPSQSLHFVHSSSSLHWLSKVPSGLMNKDKVYISKSSPKSVVDSYRHQFHEDFSMFLRSRAKEIVVKGRMVLVLFVRRSSDPCRDEFCYLWELFARALMSMALDGLVEKEKIDSFNIPFYMPSLEEVECEVEKEGSFVIDRVDTFATQWSVGRSSDQSSGNQVDKTVRALMESLLEIHFHFSPEIMDELFLRFAEVVDACYSETRCTFANFVFSLVRKG